jgi:hypothetical protein
MSEFFQTIGAITCGALIVAAMFAVAYVFGKYRDHQQEINRRLQEINRRLDRIEETIVTGVRVHDLTVYVDQGLGRHSHRTGFHQFETMASKPSPSSQAPPEAASTS